MKIYYNKSVDMFLQEAYKSTKNPIAYFILNKTLQSNISFLDVAEDDKVIVTPEVKVNKMYIETVKGKLSFEEYLDSLQVDKTGPGYTKNRIEIKLGRLIKKVVDENREYWDKFLVRYREGYDEKRTEDELIEEIVLQYKAATKKIFDKAFDTRIEIVTGSAIRKWYYQENYKSGRGSLHNSCMRHDGCRDFFEIYEKNPEVCSLLIYKESQDKIAMRALLWKLESGKMYLDRIYAADDADKTIFINYAKRNGWISFDTHKGSLSTSNLKVRLNKMVYNKYPYMDTFQWYERETNALTMGKEFNTQIKLTATNGSWSNS